MELIFLMFDTTTWVDHSQTYTVSHLEQEKQQQTTYKTYRSKKYNFK